MSANLSVAAQLISIQGQQGAIGLQGTAGLFTATTVQPKRVLEGSGAGTISAVAATRSVAVPLLEQRPCLHLLCEPPWPGPRFRRSEKSPRLSELEFLTDCDTPVSFTPVAFWFRAVWALVCDPCARLA